MMHPLLERWASVREIVQYAREDNLEVDISEESVICIRTKLFSSFRGRDAIVKEFWGSVEISEDNGCLTLKLWVDIECRNTISVANGDINESNWCSLWENLPADRDEIDRKAKESWFQFEPIGPVGEDPGYPLPDIQPQERFRGFPPQFKWLLPPFSSPVRDNAKRWHWPQD